MIMSVGYRVKSKRGIQFRRWSNKVLKQYLLKGYVVNQRLEQLERRVAATEEKIDLFVHKSLPPVEGIFYDGQIFYAYVHIISLIKQARQSIILIDNYINVDTLTMLSQRTANVSAPMCQQPYTHVNYPNSNNLTSDVTISSTHLLIYVPPSIITTDSSSSTMLYISSGPA